jgi:hypothetical protein
MLQVDGGTMAHVAKLTYANYPPIHGKFQDNFDRVKNVLRMKLSSTSYRNASLVIADGLFSLNKEDWDKDNDMWKLKEFEDLLLFFKVLQYCLIADFVL